MALNIFGQPPEYLSGLLGIDPEKLRKQAFGTGLVNTALAFAAQPRNQGYGSALPYAARALMAGQQGAQGVYQDALQGYMTKQQIEQLKRQQEQQQAQQELLAGIQDPTQRLAAQLAPKAFAESLLAQPKEKGRVLTPEEQASYGLPQDGRYQQKADGTIELISGTAPKEPAKTNLEKLIEARDRLPPDSPNRRLFDAQIAKETQFAPAPQTVVNVGQGGVAPKKIDEKFAEQFVDWTLGGGFSDVQKSLTQLEDAAATLESAPEGTITGKVIGVTSPQILKLTNPQATATKEAVEEIVQRNLRAVLGAQFTEGEGERLIARAYNPALSQKENARRVRLLQQQIFDAAQTKQDAVDYYNANGTIFGWKGKMFNSTSDFLKEYDQRIKPQSKGAKPAQKQSAPPGVEQREWDAMTPEERKLWQN
jgi:hypothetical protein